jgi:hypothetical protein
VDYRDYVPRQRLSKALVFPPRMPPNSLRSETDKVALCLPHPVILTAPETCALYSRGCGASPTRIIYHHHPTPPPPAAIHQRTARPPPATPSQTIPRRRIRTHESPRDARATQAPAGAIDHGQIRQQYPGEIAAGRPATHGELPGAKTRTASTVFTRVSIPHNQRTGCTKVLIAGESYNEV